MIKKKRKLSSLFFGRFLGRVLVFFHFYCFLDRFLGRGLVFLLSCFLLQIPHLISARDYSTTNPQNLKKRKKERNQELDQESDQEKKKASFLGRVLVFFHFSYFLDRFLSRVLVFLLSSFFYQFPPQISQGL